MPRVAVMSSDDDTPRAAFALLSWRLNLLVVVVLVAVSVLAWKSTIDDANAMSRMAMGLGQIGSRFQGSMSAAYFLTMWVTMMVAMMLPTVAPMVLAHLAVSRRRGEGTVACRVPCARRWRTRPDRLAVVGAVW